MRINVTIIIAIILSAITSYASPSIPNQFKSTEKSLKKQNYRIKEFINHTKDFHTVDTLGLFVINNKQSQWGPYGVARHDGKIIIPVGEINSYNISLYCIAGRYYILGKGNDGYYILYDINGNIIISDIDFDYIETIKIFSDEMVLIDDKLYDNDFKILIPVKGNISGAICNGNKYIIDNAIGAYTIDGRLVFKKPRLSSNDDNSFKAVEDGGFFTYWEPNAVGNFESFINPTHQNTVEICGKMYIKNNRGEIYDSDGKLILNGTIIKNFGSVILVHTTTGYKLLNENLEPISGEWDYLSYRNEDGCEWFDAANISSDLNTYKKQHPEACISHIIDMSGKSYSTGYTATFSGPLAPSVKLVNGQLCQGNKKIIGATKATLLASAATKYSKQKKVIAQSAKISQEFPTLDFIEGSFLFNGDPNHMSIEANGVYDVEFKIKNNGKGIAHNCQTIIKTSAGGIEIESPAKFNLSPGKIQQIKFRLKTGIDVAEGQASFSIRVDEPSGFGTDEQLLTVNTHAFEAPHLVVNDYTITGSGTASTLQKKQPFDLQLLVQNIEHGTADDVTIEIAVPENVFVVEGDMSMKLGRMGGGETKSLIYTLVANNRFEGNSIPVEIKMREKYGRYADNRTITLEIEQPLASSKISVSEGERKREDIKLASLTSEIDRNIPSGKTSPNTFAVIISNENYNDVPTVPHALNDGNIFREYCRKTLGIPESNIRYVGDATRNDITRHLRWLEEISNAYGNDADIIFYYSGHGVPSEKDHTSYLMPVDGYYADMSTNMSLNDIYSMLGSMNVRRVTVFLDACFSGADRSDGMLMSARGVKIKAKDSTPSGSMVVFSASQGDETAYPYNSERHGLFTYFLLKKLRETNGDVTLGELGDYIINEVRKKSVVENSKPQTPAVLASPAIASVWRDLKL